MSLSCLFCSPVLQSPPKWYLFKCHHHHHHPLPPLFHPHQNQPPLLPFPHSPLDLPYVLSASSRISHLPFSKSAHLLFLKLPIPFTLKARNAVIYFYAKYGRMDDAQKLFDEIKRPNVISWTTVLNGMVKFEGVESTRTERNEVSWTVMVVGFVEARKPREVFKVLGRMEFGNGLELNGVCICSLLFACFRTGDLAVGRWAHARLTKLDFVDGELGLIVDTALVDMYGKCGRIRMACKVFETMRVRNVVTWNVMLSGLSMHGMGYEVLRLFDRMIGEEFQRPDDITFECM